MQAGLRLASPERITPLESIRKALSASQPPHHKTCNRRVDERLAGSAQPLVVLAQAPVLAQPCEGTFHDSAPL